MQYGEEEVQEFLRPYHDRIWQVIERGYDEWVRVKRSMALTGSGPVLYPRTIANHVFDAIARHALFEFSGDPDVRVCEGPQTVKFCFGDVVVARFKKGDEDNLGRNHPTQAVLDFVNAQCQLPGMPPSAAKVELLYTANDVEDRIERVVVASRDGDELLWHYEIVPNSSADSGVVVFPIPLLPLDAAPDAGEDLVIPRKPKRDDGTSSSSGN